MRTILLLLLVLIAAADARVSRLGRYGAPPFSNKPLTPRPTPTLPNVTLGPIEIVYNWPTQHCNCSQSPGCTDAHDPDSPDTPPRATDAESRQSLRAASSPADPFFHNCTVHVASAFDCRTSSYNFQTWLHSPFALLDGLRAFTFVHMEYHGWQCVGNSSCPSSRGGDCANEAILLHASEDGGWSWAPGGAGPASAGLPLLAVSPFTYEHQRDTWNMSEGGFGDPTSIVRDPASGDYFVLISAANPPIGINGYTGPQQRGQCLMRHQGPLEWPPNASAWRAWDGRGFNADLSANPYAGPIANVSAHVCEPVNTSMLHVNLGWSTHFNAWVSSGFGSYQYDNGTQIPCCGAFLYSVSHDLLNWDTPQLLRPNKEEGKDKDWEYDAAFLDESAFSLHGERNWHALLGATPSLYFWQQDLGDAGRSVKRQSVVFDAPPARGRGGGAAAAAAPVCDAVRDCGAAADNSTDDAPRLSACVAPGGPCGAPGSTLLIPRGAALRVSSVDLSHTLNLTLLLAPGAGLFGSPDFAAFPLQPLLPPTNMPTYDGRQWRAIVWARNASGLTIAGPPAPGGAAGGDGAVIDGGGAPWWAAFDAGTLTHQRPKLVELADCSGATLRDITLRNSPFWTAHVLYSAAPRFLRVAALAPRDRGNTDGIDPTSCTDTLIADCHIDVGDDAISIKSDFRVDPATGVVTLPASERTLITNTTVLARSIAIGSSTFGGVADVRMEGGRIGDDSFSSNWAFKIKTHTPNGGVVRNISVSGTRLGAFKGTAMYVLLEPYNAPPFPPGAPTPAASAFSGILLENLAGTSAAQAGLFAATPPFFVDGLALRNVTFASVTGKEPWRCSRLQGTQSSGVTPPLPAECA